MLYVKTLLKMKKTTKSDSADGSTKLFNFNIDTEELRRLEEISEATGIDKSTLIRLAIRAFMDEVKSTGKLPVPTAPKKSTPPKQGA
jgi:hypothetical protein